jgi:UDP-GlcNAc:undecaprenyl-phosphate/decaprenyl-phosphate GlcNAc-1-phosphate transferase
MQFLILLLIPVAFVISAAATAAMKRIAPRIGFVDRPGHRKMHHAPKPLGGGVAIFVGILAPMLVGLLLVNFTAPPDENDGVNTVVAVGRALTDPARFNSPPPDLMSRLSNHWSGIRHQSPLALKLILAMLLMHLLGLWDDRKALGPFLKLIIQLGITTLLVIWADLRALTVLDDLGLGILPSVVITVLWIGAITNAFNFLDNMDGLSAGVAAVCTAAFLITALLIGQWFVAAMLALLLGALLGFLCFNFPPASIFMGDAGSLLIGLVLGVLTIRTTYLPMLPDGTVKPLGAGWYAILAPLIVLALPLYDLVVVSAIRITRGKSPFVGDTNHFSHRLVARGMSKRTAVLCIYLITAATSVAAIILPHVQTTFAAIMIFIQTVLILGVVMLLEQHPLPVPKDLVDPTATPAPSTPPTQHVQQ